MDRELTLGHGKDIPPASVVGRIGKLLVGVVQIWYAIFALRHFRQLTTPGLNPDLWLLVVLALLLLPFAVNLGFPRIRGWGRKAQLLVVAVAVSLSLIDAARTGSYWGPAVATWVLAVTIYVHLHVGASHVLAALSGLRGCEMRVIPYYLTRLLGTASTAEPLLCPGWWTPIDRWEARLRRKVT